MNVSFLKQYALGCKYSQPVAINPDNPCISRSKSQGHIKAQSRSRVEGSIYSIFRHHSLGIGTMRNYSLIKDILL